MSDKEEFKRFKRGLKERGSERSISLDHERTYSFRVKKKAKTIKILEY